MEWFRKFLAYLDSDPVAQLNMMPLRFRSDKVGRLTCDVIITGRPNGATDTKVSRNTLVLARSRAALEQQSFRKQLIVYPQTVAATRRALKRAGIGCAEEQFNRCV